MHFMSLDIFQYHVTHDARVYDVYRRNGYYSLSVLTTTESRTKNWRQLNNAFKSPVFSTAVRSKDVFLLLVIHCI